MLESKKIPSEVMAKISEHDVTELTTFTHIADSQASLRSWAKEALGLDTATAPAHATTVAKLVASWEASKKRIAKQDDQEADARASGMPRQTLRGKHLEMRAAYTTKYNNKEKLSHGEIPSATYVDSLLDQLEDGELIAEPLTEVTSLEENRDEQAPSEIAWGGSCLRLKRTKKEVPMPTATEGLRHRHRLMSVKWLMVKTKFPSQRKFQDVTENTFPALTNHILGEKVMGLTFKDASGKVVGGPSWFQCMDYEMQIRKMMLELVNLENKGVGEAMKLAINDKDLREMHFSTPAGVNAALAAVRAATGESHRGMPPAQTMPGSADSAMAFGGDASALAIPASLTQFRKKSVNWTEQDGYICNVYQRGPCNGGCGQAHKCGFCLGPHSAMDCQHRPAGKGNPPKPKGAQKGKGKGGKDKSKAKGKAKAWGWPKKGAW